MNQRQTQNLIGFDVLNKQHLQAQQEQYVIHNIKNIIAKTKKNIKTPHLFI